MFLEALGHQLKKNIITKDNESEIKFLKNGCDSCTWNLKYAHYKQYACPEERVGTKPKIAERKRIAYSSAVKEHNRRALNEMHQHLIK